MNKYLARLFAVLTALLALPALAAAQISGTNAVTALSDNVTNATNVSWPLVIAIITALIALSVFMKVGKRGGIRA